MNNDVKIELEKFLPESEGYKWVKTDRDDHIRIKEISKGKNVWYGVIIWGTNSPTVKPYLFEQHQIQGIVGEGIVGDSKKIYALNEIEIDQAIEIARKEAKSKASTFM